MSLRDLPTLYGFGTMEIQMKQISIIGTSLKRMIGMIQIILATCGMIPILLDLRGQ